MKDKTTGNLTIKKLDSVEEMLLAYPLVNQMYCDMSLDSYRSYIAEMSQANNFKMLSIYDGDKMVGVCGYWVLLMLYCGRYIQMSNLVVDKNCRNQGIGSKIMRHIEKIGRDLECKKFILDSYSENKKSHSLYYRENFHIRGFHFMKDL